MGKNEKQNQELTYAAALAEIETILARFNNETLDVDTLAGQVKRATELIRFCKGRLRKAESEVNEILDEEA